MEDIKRIENPMLRARARHLVSEQARTLAAVKLLDCAKADDLRKLGRLLNESHASMRDDFDITTPEIDALVASCVELGAWGSRMTGGGFGGCVIALVPAANRAQWQNAVLSRHPDAFAVA